MTEKLYVIVVQSEEGNVTRVLGLYGAHEYALSAADQLRKDNRPFEISVHPVFAKLPDGQPNSSPEATGD